MSLKEEIRLLRAELAAARDTDRQALASRLFEAGFSCTRCSRCCRGSYGDNTVAVFPGEVREIMAASGKSWFEVAEPPEGDDFDRQGRLHVFEWVLCRTAEGDCVFLEDGRCTVYNVRPHICRTYPFRLDSGVVESYECDGLDRRDAGNRDMVALAEALISRRIRELEESVRLLERFEPFDPGEAGDGRHIVVHDSEGSKHVCRSADGSFSFSGRPDDAPGD